MEGWVITPIISSTGGTVETRVISSGGKSGVWPGSTESNRVCNRRAWLTADSITECYLTWHSGHIII